MFWQVAIIPDAGRTMLGLCSRRRATARTISQMLNYISERAALSIWKQIVFLIRELLDKYQLWRVLVIEYDRARFSLAVIINRYFLGAND